MGVITAKPKSFELPNRQLMILVPNLLSLHLPGLATHVTTDFSAHIATGDSPNYRPS